MTYLRVKELAEQQGFTITTLSRKADLPYATVHALWHGRSSNVAITALERVAATLEVRLSDLFGLPRGAAHDAADVALETHAINEQPDAADATPVLLAADVQNGKGTAHQRLSEEGTSIAIKDFVTQLKQFVRTPPPDAAEDGTQNDAEHIPSDLARVLRPYAPGDNGVEQPASIPPPPAARGDEENRLPHGAADVALETHAINEQPDAADATPVLPAADVQNGGINAARDLDAAAEQHDAGNVAQAAAPAPVGTVAAATEPVRMTETHDVQEQHGAATGIHTHSLSTHRSISMADTSLAEVMNIPGAMAAALVDMPSGMALDKAGNEGAVDLDVAAAGNTEVVRAKLNTMKSLGIKGQIEDILITLDTQYHIIRPLGSDSTVFLYLVLNKTQANLAMARRTMQKIEASLVV